MSRQRPFTAFLLIPLLVACGTPAPAPTFTSSPPPTLTAAPPTLTPEPTPTQIPAPARAQYTLNVLMDYAAKFVTVDEAIIYPNHTGVSLDKLVLAVEPNFWPDCFRLDGVSVDGASLTNYSLESQRLELTLAAPLASKVTTTIVLRYTLSLPEIEPTNPNLSRPRIFGFSQRQINLTNWYPFVVPYIAGEWVLHDPWYYGEHLVYDAVDYEVNLTFADPNHAPVIAASGAMTPNGNGQRLTLIAGRAFAISASPEFRVSSMEVGNVVVASYYFPLYEQPGQAALDAAAQALQIYAERYNPYPHQTLAVVMGDFNDGMEFSGFFYLSRDFYNLYDGTPKNYLIFVAAHETAHQWWFEQVANDQAEQAWLDESLATYSERVFYESLDPALVQWWWSYRIDYYKPEGWVDIPIYQGTGFRLYTNAVYFRGAHFLEDLRARIGDEAFFAFLRDYLAQENGRIATSADFFRILRLHTQADLSDLLQQYFQNSY